MVITFCAVLSRGAYVVRFNDSAQMTDVRAKRLRKKKIAILSVKASYELHKIRG